jgi:hypothetical protein
MKNITLLFALMLMSTHLLLSKILHVPQEYLTIQSAINAAHNSDTVLVSEGTYYENIKYKGKGIVVTSRYFITKDWQTVMNTIIDGSTCVNKDTASTVQFINNEDSTAVLDGFTITGGTGTKHIGIQKPQEGAGIYLDGSSAIIRNNVIRNNIITPQPGANNGGGGGISSYFGNPTIYNNIIASNTAGYAGGIVLNWSKGKIRNNIIYYNTATGQYGAGGIMTAQVPQNGGIVENNTIVGNIATTSIAGGISIEISDATTIPVVKNNIVWGNRQATGGQIDNPQYITGYNVVENYSSGTNISVYPQILESSFQLSDTSPCIDAGDPSSAYNDIEDLINSGMALLPSKGTVRNDIGAYGGFFSKTLSPLNIYDIYIPKNTIDVQCSIGQQVNTGFAIRNLSSKKIIVDSVSHSNNALFHTTNYSGKVFELFLLDSLKLYFAPIDTGTFYDTIKVYHNTPNITNPLTFSVRAKAIGTPSDVQEKGSINHNFQLFQNYPNPFNPSTRIGFNIPHTSFVTIKIFDILGREVATLVNGRKEAGQYSIRWDASTMPSGMYFYCLQTGNYTKTNTMVLIK